MLSSVPCPVAWVCVPWCCHCAESKWLMMSVCSAPVSASRSQMSQPNTGEHRSLDRNGLLFHRRNSGFPPTGSGSVALGRKPVQGSTAHHRFRAPSSSGGLESTRVRMLLGRRCVEPGARSAPSNTTCLESTEQCSSRRMTGNVHVVHLPERTPQLRI